jgi:hypothetical protein
VAAAVALAAAGGITLVVVSSGGQGSAFAETSLRDYVPIDRVAPNVPAVRPRAGASTGVFTVDCGVNANGKFSPDNPVAQPGVKNGAEHVHDFVGNQAITADTSDEALAAAGTTCRNGDRSSYFWPVVRIDRSVRPAGPAPGVRTHPFVSCPRVADRLPAVPEGATAEVRRHLRRLDRHLADANRRLAAGPADPARVNAVLARLRAERAATVTRIEAAAGRSGARPAGLVSAVECEIGYGGAHAGHRAAGAATAPVATPSVRCPSVRGRLLRVPAAAVDEVNRNLDLLDRQIAEADERLVSSTGQGGPDFVRNAVVGPLVARRVATLDRIAVAIGRSGPRPSGLADLAPCTVRNAAPPAGRPDTAPPLPAPSGPDLELPGNTGGIVRPAAVRIEYRGNPGGRVVPMPRFLRALTGDAKPTSRGPANARATWTCSGFADRLSAKYPICPAGSRVMRVHDFPGCWDGENVDSANHRSHLAFADPASGACPAGFVAVPQLRISITYDIPADVQRRGQYALDSFPEENHNPFSDHNDFVNVNAERTMKRITACINAGRRCT